MNGQLGSAFCSFVNSLQIKGLFGKVLSLTSTFSCECKSKGLHSNIIEADYRKDIIDRKFGPGSKMEFVRNRILGSHFSIAYCKDTGNGEGYEIEVDVEFLNNP